MQFSVRMMASARALIIGADGTLLGKSEPGFPTQLLVGEPFDPSLFRGLEAPYAAAMRGEIDSKYLYSIQEPDNRFTLAIPVFDPTTENANYVVGLLEIYKSAIWTLAYRELKALEPLAQEASYQVERATASGSVV